jgi:hypothetical protein
MAAGTTGITVSAIKMSEVMPVTVGMDVWGWSGAIWPCTVLVAVNYNVGVGTNFIALDPSSGNFYPIGVTVWNGVTIIRKVVQMVTIKPVFQYRVLIWPVGTVFATNNDPSFVGGGLSMIDPQGDVYYNWCADTMTQFGMKGTITALHYDMTGMYL